MRIPFTVSAATLSSLTSLTLKMQYSDGYVAYLNGVEIASENAPTSPTWNSVANEQQTSDVQATTYEDVDVSSFLNSSTAGHLTSTGTNVLAIQVLSATASPTQMLVVPELGQMTSTVSSGDLIFSTPSPGAANTLADVQPSITFSSTDGLYYASTPVTLTPDARGHAHLLHHQQRSARRPAGREQHHLQRHDRHRDHRQRGRFRHGRHGYDRRRDPCRV